MTAINAMVYLIFFMTQCPFYDYNTKNSHTCPDSIRSKIAPFAAAPGKDRHLQYLDQPSVSDGTQHNYGCRCIRKKLNFLFPYYAVAPENCQHKKESAMCYFIESYKKQGRMANPTKPNGAYCKNK